MADILVLNGPNLNMLGTREPHIYGHMTLDEIETASRKKADSLGLSLDWFQSNSESALITRLQQASQNRRAIIINAAAYTHTSYAVRDALALFDGPKVEVHLSKNFNRESFRQISTISPICDGTIVGFGFHSYLLGIQAIESLLNPESKR
ncbi:type II 3-dehydroquinate dehydratase [Candidatus Puniceispirillum marinum]|uniref:3-dehydroquinate dehydratase n=1 Tax=Puniceispirillum marinum (strain IMCC1322) TaxID=488538 RepID=D5BSB5_PUNMI|nr:3-dehydroquinate dehydratase, type II [Candidatus Puniceispirillum marinum IMCC1322]